jgi:hypothetical protein
VNITRIRDTLISELIDQCLYCLLAQDVRLLSQLLQVGALLNINLRREKSGGRNCR